MIMIIYKYIYIHVYICFVMLWDKKTHIIDFAAYACHAGPSWSIPLSCELHPSYSITGELTIGSFTGVVIVG